MAEKRFVRISYTAKIEDGRVFDTTSAETAKKEGVFEEKKVYKPVALVVGEKQVIEGLDEELAKMKKGEEKTIDIPPEKAFGKRDPKLVRLVPLSLFKKQNMRPIPGMPIEIDGRTARVQTVAGGRVRVDFNSDLAGRTVKYNVKIEDEAKTEDEKIRYIIERSFNDSKGFEFKKTGKSLEVTLPEDAYKDRNLLVRKASLFAEAKKFLGADKLIFVEVWGKEDEKKEEKPKPKAKEKAE